MSQMIGEELEKGAQLDGENIDYAFDLSEFFATDDKGKFIHEQDVKKLAKYSIKQMKSIHFSTKELRNELKHYFLAVRTCSLS